MRTALDADPSQLDEHERSFVDNVRKHGWMCMSIAADAEGPRFAYTTGFWLNLNFPEIITFSLGGGSAHDTLWHVFREIKCGRRFKIREPAADVFVNLNAFLLPVPTRQFEQYLGWSRWFYGGDAFQCVQLVWPDRNGNFPWQAGFVDDTGIAQPDLTGAHWSRLGRN